MTIEELLTKLTELHVPDDSEYDHIKADKLLLEYIGNDKVTEAFDRIEKWYA
jgi:hypothetical protein